MTATMKRTLIAGTWGIMLVVLVVSVFVYMNWPEEACSSTAAQGTHESAAIAALRAELAELRAEQEQARETIVRAVSITDSRGKVHEVQGASGTVEETEAGAKLFRIRGAAHMPEFEWKTYGNIEFPVLENGLVLLGEKDTDLPPNIPVKEGCVWVRVENARFAGPFGAYVKKGILWGIQKAPSKPAK